MTPRLFRSFLFYKLPIAWLAGLRLVKRNEESVTIGIRLHRWSQNPFKSIFWAVQGMAAEISTGLLCISRIKQSGEKISMLVVEMQANFTKKAVGKVKFTCEQGKEVKEIIDQVIQSDEGHTLWLTSRGVDENGDQVAEFKFCWSFKKNSKKAS